MSDKFETGITIERAPPAPYKKRHSADMNGAWTASIALTSDFCEPAVNLLLEITGPGPPGVQKSRCRSLEWGGRSLGKLSLNIEASDKEHS